MVCDALMRHCLSGEFELQHEYVIQCQHTFIDRQTMHGNFELAQLTRPPPLTGRFLRPQSGGLGDPEQQRRSRHQSTSARRRRTYPRRHHHRPKKRRRKRRSRSRHHRSRGSSHRGQRRCRPSRAASASAESGPAGSSAAAQSTAAAPPSQRTCGHATDAKQREGQSRRDPAAACPYISVH